MAEAVAELTDTSEQFESGHPKGDTIRTALDCKVGPSWLVRDPGPVSPTPWVLALLHSQQTTQRAPACHGTAPFCNLQGMTTVSRAG